MIDPSAAVRTAADELRALLAGDTQALGFGLQIAGVQQRLGLSDDQLGEALALATADADLVAADRALWTHTAILALGLVDDLYQLVQEARLWLLCDGFLRARMRATDDRERARLEAEELVRVWTIRLTGYPLLYDYFDLDRLHGFAGDLLGTLLAGLREGGQADPEAEIRAFVERLTPAVAEGHGPRLDAARLVARILE